MNPYLQHHLADERVADMHRHAERQRIARAARRARRAARRPGAQPVAGPGSMFTPLRTQPFSTT